MLRPIDEIRFWTEIMRDHGEFILTSLSYNEQEAIYSANFYKETFSRLHEQSKRMSGTDDTNAVSPILEECLNALVSFINFKRLLLGRVLTCQLNTSLPPTFYNHMINEAMEFYKALMDIKSNVQADPLLANLNLHMIWLPDAAGHAATIASDLDPVEKNLIEEAQEFEKRFNAMTIKIQELSKMLTRTSLMDGALKYMNEEAKKSIEEFIYYLDKIRKLKARCKILSVLKLLMPDHMIREENYYLHKIMSYQ